LLLDAALVQEHDFRGHVAGEAHFVGDHQHGAAVERDLAHHAEHFADQLRVERRRGLVEQHHFRLHDKGARDGGALLLTARQVRRVIVAAVMQADTLQVVLGALECLRARLGFIGAGVFVDQHVIARGRFGRMLPAMLASGDRIGLGVDEDTALIVRGGVAEVAGRSGVVLIDLRSATVQAAQPLALRDARISYLGSGDQAVLATGAVTVAAARRGGTTLDHTAPDFAPEYSEPRFFWDWAIVRSRTCCSTLLKESRPARAAWR
jgi:hypothetical protein